MEHIGQVIKQELERQERTVVWLARKLSCDRSNIYRIFQKESIDTNYLFVFLLSCSMIFCRFF